MRFTNLVAVLVCLVLFSSTCSAAVVYSGRVNIPVTPDSTGTSINLLSGELNNPDTYDVNFSYVGGFNPSHPWLIGLSFYLVDPFDAALAGSYVGPLEIPSTRLYGVGFPIGPDSSFLDQPNNNGPFFTAPDGNAGQQAILGLRLGNIAFGDTDPRYAWIRIQLAHTADQPSYIVDYAVETDANTPILSGLPFPTPEPSSFVLAALGLASLALVRWRRAA